MLYIVSVPIWNLEDITFRAVKILNQVNIILCEDTRHSLILLKKYDIKWKKLISFHSYSTWEKIFQIIDLLKKWEEIALISDSWTPWISDPLFKLSSKCYENNIKIVPIPWASAFLTCLQWSGIWINKFSYYWFPPAKKWRNAFFEEIKSDKKTVVFYESCHRIWKTLSQILEIIWNREIIIWRELTKIHEEFFRWNVSNAIKRFEKAIWEFVIILPMTREDNELENH